MADSDFVFEQGEAINVGQHGENDYMFASGEPVPNSGQSDFVYQSGVGLGGELAGLWADDFHDGKLTNRASYEDLPHAADLDPEHPRFKYVGDTDSFNIQSSDVKLGDYALESSESFTSITDSSVNVGRDVLYGCWMKATGEGDALMMWNVAEDGADPDDVPSYHIQHGGDRTNFRLRKRNPNETLYQSAALNSGQWYWFEVEHTSDGDITGRAMTEPGGSVVDSTGTINDTSHTEGGIGWGTRTSDGGKYDDLRVEPLGGTPSWEEE